MPAADRRAHVRRPPIVPQCWPEDGGPFVTLPLVYTEHPDRLGHNLGIYRTQVHDARTTGHWQIGKGAEVARPEPATATADDGRQTGVGAGVMD